MGKQWLTLFWGASKSLQMVIAANEIKRRLLLGRKVMTHLDSILKSRDITLPASPWCHPTISSSVVPFSSCLQSFPAPGSFPMSLLFTSGGQSIGVSGSALVLLMNIQDWFPLGWTGWISSQSKNLSRVFSNTTVQKLNSLVLSLLYGPTLTSKHDYCKNRSFEYTDFWAK